MNKNRVPFFECMRVPRVLLRLVACLVLPFSRDCQAITVAGNEFHVFEGDNIQEALRSAAEHPTRKIVKVHAGTYRPNTKRQALIWFNRMHEGIRLEAVGDVTLTAANPAIAESTSPSYPAVVNHVVYFGHGLSSNTSIQGFRITGANGFMTDRLIRQIEPDTTVPKNSFFLTDGGAIKIFGRSYPILRDLEIVENYTSPCGAGVSIQHQGYKEGSVLLENCTFLRNRTQVTGAAVDLLEGSSARLLNCLFVGNISNTGIDVVAQKSGERPFTNSGAMTIFQRSGAWVERCTFAGNRNGVDDLGGESTYLKCLFYNNNLDGSLAGGKRYELDLPEGAKVSGCLFSGAVIDPKHSISDKENASETADPKFTADFSPQAPHCENTGYRPKARSHPGSKPR